MIVMYVYHSKKDLVELLLCSNPASPLSHARRRLLMDRFREACGLRLHSLFFCRVPCHQKAFKSVRLGIRKGPRNERYLVRE